MFERAPFENRSDAGRRLAEALALRRIADPVVAAVLRGGVPVGAEIARVLHCPVKLLILRKLHIPSNPEAGFGAMAPDGTVHVDREFADLLGLTDDEVGEVIREVAAEIRRRQHAFPRIQPGDVAGRDVIAVDDGIAAGYTMQAAITCLRALKPRTLSVAVPCGHVRSLRRIRPLVDDLICLRPSGTSQFAVASFYRHWRDLTDDDVRKVLTGLPESGR